MTAVTPREETQAKLDRMAAANMAHTPNQTYTIADRLEERVKENADRPFLIYGDQTQTYTEANKAANQVAHAAKEIGLSCGDVAGIMLENRLEFFAMWLGLAKIGVTVALINTNARGKALQHAIDVTNSKAIFIGEECIEAFDSIDTSTTSFQSYLISDAENSAANIPSDIKQFDDILASASTENFPASIRDGLVAENFIFYIFTSGTTGLPKAARISHMKWLGVGDGMRDMLELNGDDVFYCALPLYHGAAGMSLTSSALSVGGSIVIRRRFSVSRFWQEIRDYKVTTCQYIGEICRYLYNQPAQPNDKDHCLKKMMGAGMGPDIWAKFQDRFGIANIYEGWGATEANTNMINVDNKVASCGRLPYNDKTNARLVRYDLENDCHYTDDNGHMIECKPGEVGEILGMILNLPNVGAGRFEGYTSEEATEKKILHNVFQDGDSWWRSGDLFKKDEDDYFYFVDRVGDTFRWKSENVSTSEVAEALGDFDGLEIINVYGVKVTGQEGRAGMASLIMKEGASFDPDALFALTESRLPKYAAPLFIRISSEADMTATFKLRKVDLQKQGYNPAKFDDPLLVRDEKNKTYTPYSEELLERLDILPFEGATATA